MQKDAKLGFEVRDHLKSMGIEHLTTEKLNIDREIKLEKVAASFKNILIDLGLDPVNDANLVETPKRYAKLMVNEMCSGYDYNNFPKCTTVPNDIGYNDSFLIIQGANGTSMCSHHAIVMDFTKEGKGTVTLAYIPKDNVLGISKLVRIFNFFARRMVLQEQLTKQVVEAIKFITGADDVACYLDGRHYCMVARGAENHSASTVTFYGTGKFLTDPNTRREFLDIARG